MQRDNQDGNINPFKLINQVDQLPPDLKRDVLATINHTRMVTDIAKLFTVDMLKTASKMIDSGEQ